jgi:hypothetical protein
LDYVPTVTEVFMLLTKKKECSSRLLRGALSALIGAGFLLLLITKRSADASPSADSAKHPIPPIQNGRTLKCRTESFATIDASDGKIKGSFKPSTGQLTLTAVNGKLVVVGDEGGEALSLLSTNPLSGGMYFFQRTAVGNVCMWAFHPLKDGRVFFSEQLSLQPGGIPVDGVAVWSQAGYCEATGGDGRPIRQ